MPPKGIEKFEISRPTPGETPKPGELLPPDTNIFNQSPFRELFFHEDIFPHSLWSKLEDEIAGFVAAMDLFIHHMDPLKDALAYVPDHQVKTSDDKEMNKTNFNKRQSVLRDHLREDEDPVETTLTITENLRIYFQDHPYAFKYLHEHMTGRDGEFTPWGNAKRKEVYEYMPTFATYAKNQELSKKEDILVGISREVTGLSTIEDIRAALPPKSSANKFHRYGKSQSGSMSHKTFID